MKMKRLGVLLVSCICSAMMLTGCSVEDVKSGISETTQKIFGKTQEVTGDTEKKEKIEKSGKTVDESVEKPEFTSNLGGTVQITMGSTYGIACPAKVEKGNITYQWYTNNVNSNGGGTPLAGATSEQISVDSSTPSHKFYYVVATNEENGKINKSTSDTLEVIIWDIGTWQEGEEGIVRYMMIDGTYPKSTWFMIDENVCYVKDNGNRSTGLVTIDDVTYYFSDDGYLQRNTFGPNGEPVDENGIVHPLSESEQPAEAASEAPAEEAPAEQPAEEVLAE